MSAEVVRYPSYRWVVLGIAWVTILCLYLSWYLIPSLASRLSPELGLTHMQYTLIFTGPVLMGIFGGIPAGASADRYGIRLVVAIAAFIGGIAGLARAFTASFEVMFALMCLLGLAIYGAMPNLPKLVSIWFPPGQKGLAAGIYITAPGIGMSLGLFTGPLFGGWKVAFTYIGILTLVIAILWTLLARKAPKGIKIHMPPMVSGIKRGIRSRNLWLTCTAHFLFMGTFTSFSANFPEALESIHNVSPATAGAIASLLTGGAVAGNLLIPTISDRVGLRKPFIYAAAITIPACLFFAWHLAPGAATLVLILVGGFMLGGLPPIMLTLPLEFPEISHEHVGGASGLLTSSLALGGFTIPLFVMSPLVAAGTSEAYSTGFLVIMLLIAAMILPTLFLMETGSRARARQDKASWQS